MPERLKAARHKVVGAKQTLRALQAEQALVVYVARNADERVAHNVIESAAQQGVELVEVESISKLGRLCGIEVGAACAAIIMEPAQLRPIQQRQNGESYSARAEGGEHVHANNRPID